MSDRPDSTSNPSPTTWNESYGFRETFLQHFTEPGHAAALTLISIMMYDYALEAARHWPDPGESPTRLGVRAVAKDLRWLADYLDNLGRQREQSSLPPADASLSELAGRLASEVARLADILQRAVA